MLAPAWRDLAAAVQANADLADARHAGELPLCIFLLQMREYFRWQQGLAYGAPLDRQALGHWLAACDQRWAEIEAQDYSVLPLPGQALAPFDVDAVNAVLRPHGLVYGAGWLDAARPSFFLAELARGYEVQQGGATWQVQQCGREHARNLFAPPAALQGGRTIVLRRESLDRWLWERFETFAARGTQGAGADSLAPFSALAQGWGLHSTAAFVAALPALAEAVTPVLLLHEQGEAWVGQRLEPGWAALRLALSERRSSLRLRAVRDLLADLGLTLPALLDRADATALHFWFATYEGAREALFPTLPLAYQAWRGGDGGLALRAACRRGTAHFEALALDLLRLADPPAVGRRLDQAAAVLR